MKGLSPLIATVLLIAFTVGVAGILSVFFSSYTSEQTSAVDKRTSGTVECSGAFLRVERVNTSSSPSIVISNPTNNKVYVMSVIDNLGNINTTPATVQRAITTSVITVSINPNNVPH
jgi:flagellin-like protein